MEYSFTEKDLLDVSMNASLYESLEEICRSCSKKADDFFFHSISKVLHDFTGIYSQQLSELKAEEILKIKESVFLAVKLFREALDEVRIEKLLASLHILSYFEQDFSLLQFSLITDDFKKRIADVTKGINLIINVGDGALYNEKKMLEVLGKAKENKDFPEIMGIMDTLIHNSNVFGKIKNCWGALINFTAFIDRSIIYDILENTDSYEKVDAFLFALKSDFFQNVNFRLKNNYFLLRLFKFWLNSLEKSSNYTDELVEIFSDSLLKIEPYIGALRISNLASYNFLMGQLLSKNNSFLGIYINHISFGIKESQAFTRGFLQGSDSNDADKNLSLSVIEAVKNIFLEYAVESYSKIDSYTGFQDLFVYYWFEKNKSKNDFIKSLSDFSGKIKQLQDSWN